MVTLARGQLMRCPALMPSNGTRGHPLWRFDRQRLRSTEAPGIVGVDEAGRGALAGPVVAAAAFLSNSAYEESSFRRHSRAINDSKQLSPEERDAQFVLIESWRIAGLVLVAPGVASVEEIESLNILGATRLAMQRALEAIDVALCPAGEDAVDELIGSEMAASQFPLMLVDGKPLKPFPWAHTGVVGGDGKSLAIAMASIVAKVTRDRLMVELHQEDGRYGYNSHKGYGAPKHVQAIHAHGASVHHRSKFLRKLISDEPSAEQVELF
ncbi:MAG: ribonuclease HII [Verrucomicrobiota bacterium]